MQKKTTGAHFHWRMKGYLADVPEVFTLNKNGKRKKTVRFTHAAHMNYAAGITCQTCHHFQEGDDQPEKCSECHDVRGIADEARQMTRAFHSNKRPFPQEGEDEVSCMGCHKAQNALLAEGKRSGNAAPTKCIVCHKNKALFKGAA